MKKVTFYLASFLITSGLLVTPRAVEAQSVDATADSEIIKTLDRNCSSVRVAIKLKPRRLEFISNIHQL